MKFRLFMALAGIALFTGACADTFLVYKDGRAYFLEGNSKAKQEMLCASGDINKILADTHLDAATKESLFKYNCSKERSTENIRQLYLSMTAEQRKDIKTAFRKNGYEINKMAC